MPTDEGASWLGRDHDEVVAVQSVRLKRLLFFVIALEDVKEERGQEDALSIIADIVYGQSTTRRNNVRGNLQQQ